MARIFEPRALRSEDGESVTLVFPLFVVTVPAPGESPVPRTPAPRFPLFLGTRLAHLASRIVNRGLC